MLIADAHQDLAWNILTFDRDYTRAAAETRRLERNSLAPERNGDTLLGWPDYQRGRVAVIFATLFAAPERRKLGDWDACVYANVGQAHSLYQEQLDVYHRLVDDHPDKFRLILDQTDLNETLAPWRALDESGLEKNELEEPQEEREAPPAEEAEEEQGLLVGSVVLMEGAEGVRAPGELEEWWARGVRLIGPAWAGTRFCGGTHEPGPLTKEGYALLDGMAELGFILDLSHMDEQAALQALDHYPGAIVATHANPAAMHPIEVGNRFLTDRLIHGLLERDAIIGIVPNNLFLNRAWEPTDGRQAVTLENVAAHLDYICQLAGDARHAGLGSDFDGGFGLQSVPAEIDTIADLQKLAPVLAGRGYSDEDVAAILGGNWLSMLRLRLPET